MTLLSIPYKDTLVPISEVHGNHFFAEDGRVFHKNYKDYEILFDNKYIIYKGEAVKISLDPGGFWRDRFGTIFDIIDRDDSLDPVVRCGVGPFSLSKDHSLTAWCAGHDHAYSSKVFQAFNSRKDADRALALAVMNSGYPLVGNIFYVLTRWFGRFFWENKKTN